MTDPHISPLSATLGQVPRKPTPLAAVPAADPAAPHPLAPSSEAWAAFLSKMEAFKRDLNQQVMAEIRSDAFLQRLVEMFLRADVLDSMIETKLTNFTERLAQTSAPAPAADTQPKLLGFKAVLSAGQMEPEDDRVMFLGPDHPVNPNGVEFYRDSERDGHWHLQSISDMVAKALHEAYKSHGCTPGKTYWCKLHTITDRPLGPESVQLGGDVASMPSEVVALATGGGNYEALGQTLGVMANLGEVGFVNQH